MVEHYWNGDAARTVEGGVKIRCDCGWSTTYEPEWETRPGESPAAPSGLLSDADHEQLHELWRQHVAPLAEPDPGTVLIWRDDTGRHHLNGEALHNGEALEVQMPDGSWWRGRYETTRRDGELVPLFFAQLGGPAAENNVPDYLPRVSFEIPPRAVLRRPERHR